MDRLPPEILHVICANLKQKEIQEIRLVNKKFAVVGAHYLITEVSFFLSAESFERLHQLAEHPIFSLQVKDIHYQANLLREIKSVKLFKDVMNRDHPHGGRPEPPDPDATEREVRLYWRNEQKWRRGVNSLSTRQIGTKMRSYATVCAAQQQDIKNGIENDVLSKVMKCFPNLRQLVFTARPTCCHAYSQRFMARFKDLGITPPTKPDTAITVSQLGHYLSPLAGTKVQLESLKICYISPEVLRMPKLSIMVTSIKYNLEKINDCCLNFKLDAARVERLHDDDGSDVCYATVKDGGLPLLLSHMPNLQKLWVSFDDCPCSTKISTDHIVGDHKWPNLKEITLQQFATTADSLFEFLKRHDQNLRCVRFSNSVLTEGSWIAITRRMRMCFSLEDATFTESLRGNLPDENWEMRSFNVDGVGDDWNTLSDDLNFYICSATEDMEFDDDDMSDEFSEFGLLTNPLENDLRYVHPDEIEEDDFPEFLTQFH